MKYYCRRYKLRNDPDLIFKVREKEYNTPSLFMEPEEDAHWYWLDAVPFVEEYKTTV